MADGFINKNMRLLTGERKREVYEMLSVPFRNRPVYFLKYCKEKEHAQDIINGNLYIRSARVYKEIEEQTGERGTGDKNEMICPIPTGTPFSISIGEQTFNIPINEISEATLVDSNDLDMLVYCLTWVDFPTIDDIEIFEDEENFKWKSIYKLDNMDTSEYKYCVVIHAVEEFYSNIFKYLTAHNAVCFRGMVEYESTVQQRFEDFSNMSARRFFYKDRFFKNQNEFRIVTNISEPQDNKLKLGKKVGGFILSLEDNKELVLAGGRKIKQ